ncbi:DUF58 domain-containing protein [soil metagenome]
MAFSGRLVLLVAAGAVPIVVFDEPLWLPGWLIVVAVLGSIDLILAGSPRRLLPSRELPARLRLGETATSTLYLANTGRRRVRGVVRDGWQPSAGAAPSRARIDLPAGERRAVVTLLTPFRRGQRHAAQVTVRSYGPLHLLARQATLEVPGTIRVLPRFAARKHLPSRLARLRELDGTTSVMVRGQGTEFDSLREYVRGDDVRSIDWRATARRSDPNTGFGPQLVVRTWRPERDRRVVILIDSGRSSAARVPSLPSPEGETVGDEPRIDTAFESALLLAGLATRAGDRVDLLIYDRRVRGRVQGATGAELLARMVDVMAPIEPELLEPDWAAIPGLLRSVSPHRALVVLLTTVDAPASATGLLTILPELARKHTVLVASVTDPSLVSIAAERGDRREIYRAAAAERALLDISRVSAALRLSGAEVVTGTPAELPPVLADRYLDLKAAGRL